MIYKAKRNFPYFLAKADDGTYTGSAVIALRGSVIDQNTFDIILDQNKDVKKEEMLSLFFIEIDDDHSKVEELLETPKKEKATKAK
jgi:hypothetical protein